MKIVTAITTNRWFHAAYVDAYHRVTTPNVVGMGVYGTDAVSTKPYAASARYVDRTSDFCAGCRYDPGEATGGGARPFDALYWDFLARNGDELRENPRMTPSYANWDRKGDDERQAIRERATTVRAAGRRRAVRRGHVEGQYVTGV